VAGGDQQYSSGKWQLYTTKKKIVWPSHWNPWKKTHVWVKSYVCPNSPSDTMYPNSPSDTNISVFNWDNPSLHKQKNCVSSTTNTGQVYKYKLYKHDWQHNQQTSKSYFNTTVKSSLMKMIIWLSNLWVISNWPWALKQFLALTQCHTHTHTHTMSHCTPHPI